MFANGTAEANDGGNPYRDSNIGVEKLLELNSEENHDDVCLSYIFTYRDFADGVLGLAWVGEAGNKNFYIKVGYVTLFVCQLLQCLGKIHAVHECDPLIPLTVPVKGIVEYCMTLHLFSAKNL